MYKENNKKELVPIYLCIDLIFFHFIELYFYRTLIMYIILFNINIISSVIIT